jgi:tripartite-type tricarboxylate transporter receptor subunit TctC
MGILRALGLAFMLAAYAAGAAAEDYPDHAMELINPYAAGGPVDLLARALAREFNTSLKQPIVVIDKTGAGAAIGATYVARAKPDGYTVLLGTAAAFFITPATSHTSYGMGDFRYVGMIDNAANVLVVNPKLDVHTLKEFIALAKSEPGKLSYGSSGIGTSPHVGMEEFKMRAGIDLVHVPYRGAAPAVIDLIDGHVQAGLINLSGVLPYIKSGQLRAIAYASSERSALLPDVPTFAQAGLPDFTSGSWHALAVPAATPAAVVDRLAKALAQAQQSPEFRKSLDTLGTEAFPMSPAETTRYIGAEAQRTLALFKATHMKFE